MEGLAKALQDWREAEIEIDRKFLHLMEVLDERIDLQKGRLETLEAKVKAVEAGKEQPK